MNEKITKMSKEELIKYIVAADELGRELEESAKTLAKERDELLLRADELELKVGTTVHTMERLALAQAEMRQVLKDKYGSFVM